MRIELRASGLQGSYIFPSTLCPPNTNYRFCRALPVKGCHPGGSGPLWKSRVKPCVKKHISNLRAFRGAGTCKVQGTPKADRHYETTPMWTRLWPYGDRTYEAEAGGGGVCFSTDNVQKMLCLLGPDQSAERSYRPV